jgi:adenylate cyclase
MSSKLRLGLLSGFIASLLILLAWQYQWLEGWEYTTWRWRVRHYAKPSVATQRIKLILLDQASLDWGFQIQHWPWPWPREAYAALIRFTQRGKAKVVAFDVLFTEDSVYGVADDQILGEAIRQAGNVVTGMFLSPGQDGQSNAWPADAPSSGLPQDELLNGRKPLIGPSMRHASFPVPDIARHSAALGHVVGYPDRDAVIRRMNLFARFDAHAVPSLGLAAFLIGNPPRHISLAGRWLSIDDRRIPLDPHGHTILNYRGTTNVYDVYRAKDILNAEIRIRQGETPAIEPAVFNDTYVVFGFSAPGLLDLSPTPLSPVAPGAMIQATLIDNLLASDALQNAPPSMTVLLILLFSLGAALAVTSGRRLWHTMAAFVVFLPLPVVVAFIAYAEGYWLPMVAPLLAVAIALTGAVWVNYATEGRQRAYIRHAFEHYLSPVVIKQLIDNPNRLQLGGERRELTMMFTDLQGFSSISEHMDAPTLTALLNDYLADMSAIILQEGGTLDKYEGDAIIAFWNAPVDQPDHAMRACRAALRCQRRLAERRQALFERSGANLIMRIGLNSGPAVVGNMGSQQRFDYTMLGDQVNLAARLEGANKEFGTFLMVSEQTWAQVNHQFIGRELATLRVVGRRSPVTVYEIVGFAGEARPDYLDIFEDALHFYKQNDLHSALARFQQLPDDPPSQAYARRCRHALACKESGGELVWHLTSK